MATVAYHTYTRVHKTVPAPSTHVPGIQKNPSTGPVWVNQVAARDLARRGIKMRSWARACGSLSFLLLSLFGAFYLSSCAAPSAEQSQAAPYRIPRFPWPPPQASAAEIIPRRLLEVQAGPTRLRDVDRRISEALEQNGYYDSSYYAVPAGFALVTRMEQIESDATSKRGRERWALTTSRLVRFSLSSYLAALFRATPGYYRVIVFLVTPYPFAQSAAEVTQEEAMKWLSEGFNCLPGSIGDLDYSAEGYACTALIYEFERAAETEGARIQLPGRIPGRTHLVKAGIWEVLEQ
jgi:hypothetical protein